MWSVVDRNVVVRRLTIMYQCLPSSPLEPSCSSIIFTTHKNAHETLGFRNRDTETQQTISSPSLLRTKEMNV